MQNNNCDGSAPHTNGEVRVLPAGGDANMILCKACWSKEISYRRMRNRSLGDFARFKLPKWEDLKVYETV